ncbi:peptide IlvX [Enterobacter mori]
MKTSTKFCFSRFMTWN